MYKHISPMFFLTSILLHSDLKSENLITITDQVFKFFLVQHKLHAHVLIFT